MAFALWLDFRGGFVTICRALQREARGGQSVRIYLNPIGKAATYGSSRSMCRNGVIH